MPVSLDRPLRRRLRAAAVPAVLVLAAAALTGCQSDDPPPDLRYVALGDSFAAAPGVPPEADDATCSRSIGNYPHLVADQEPDYTLVDVSCTGATTGAMVSPQVRNLTTIPPQLDALTEDTDLVTLSVGGNDYNFITTLLGRCGQLRPQDPTGSPCREEMSKTGPDVLLADTRRIGQNVEKVLGAIQEAAPDAQVLLVGYPMFFPEQGTCPDLLPLADGDVAYAHELNVRLVQETRDAARRAGAEYVDTAAAFAGHDICAEDPWVNGHVADPGAAAAYHAFAVGQQAVADLVVAQL
jgi:lysophospholipase L1-like esterase